MEKKQGVGSGIEKNGLGVEPTHSGTHKAKQEMSFRPKATKKRKSAKLTAVVLPPSKDQCAAAPMYMSDISNTTNNMYVPPGYIIPKPPTSISEAKERRLRARMTKK